MDNKQKKPIRNVLGRGLSSLISSSPVPIAPHRINTERRSVSGAVEGNLASDLSKEHQPQEGAEYLAIDKIVNNPNQPRQEFDQAELQELAESIRSLGVLQPILVRPSASIPGTFEIVAGERRWRASKLAKLTEVPVIVHKLTDTQALEIAIVENVQRSELNPIEEARAYERLMTEFSLGQKEVAERVGKDRATVANATRLLKLPGEVQTFLIEGKLSSGHAKAILTIKEPSAQISLAKKTINDNLSVRALEEIVSRVVVLDGGAKARKQSRVGDNNEGQFPEILDRMRNALGTKVTVKHKKSGSGKIEIEYYSEQELNRLVDILSK